MAATSEPACSGPLGLGAKRPVYAWGTQEESGTIPLCRRLMRQPRLVVGEKFLEHQLIDFGFLAPEDHKSDDLDFFQGIGRFERGLGAFDETFTQNRGQGAGVFQTPDEDRKSVVKGKSVSVRVYIGVPRYSKKN